MVSIAQGMAWPEEPLFSLGRTVATRGVLADVEMEAVYEAVARHERGDWGLMPPEDKAANNQALGDEGRLVSKWRDNLGTEFYVITEADRSYTTALLIGEY